MQPFTNVDTILSYRPYKQMAGPVPGAMVKSAHLGLECSSGLRTQALKPGCLGTDPVSTT